MIETERLRLRGWRSSDKSRFAEITNTPRVLVHMGGVKPLTEIEDLIDKQIAMQAAHGLSMWAMEDKATRLIIGICGLRYGGHPNTPVSDELEIGWRVAESAWGKEVRAKRRRPASRGDGDTLGALALQRGRCNPTLPPGG